MTILLAAGDCFSAFLLGPVFAELRARGVEYRLAAAASEPELAGLRNQLGAESSRLSVFLADDDVAAKQFAEVLLASQPSLVAYLGVTPFTRQLAQAAAVRNVRVIRLDAGVSAFGRPLPEHPWADAWCVAGEQERLAVLARITVEPGHASRPVVVVGDLVTDAVASAGIAGAKPPTGIAMLFERESGARPSLQEQLRSTGLATRAAPARDADVAAWVAHAANAQFAITDSVGWQRVAVAVGVPCAVLPTSGLWAPGVAAGLVTQLPPAGEDSERTLQRLAHQPHAKPAAPGGAAARVVDFLLAPPRTLAVALPSEADATGRTFTNDEAALVTMVLQRGTLNSTRGTMVTTFERRFAQWLGRKHAIACASGSAAVHIAVAALQLQPGDEVITTPITDMGALTPILYEGAVPVFADVDARTLNVTAATIEAQLTERTRAIVVTHLFGLPADLDAIGELAAARGIALIEDAAQAFGATWRGRKVGTFGRLAAFSLQQGKHITSGEGGIVATDDDALARRVFLYVNKAWGYGDKQPDHYFPALNYRLTELQGAVLVAQLPKLDGVVEARRTVAAGLRRALAGVPGLHLPDDPAHGTHSYWKFAFFVDDGVVPGGAVALGKQMQQSGIACVPRYIQKPAFECELFRDWRKSPVTWLPLQQNPRRERATAMFARADYPGAIDGLEHVVVLPINECYSEAHVAHVAARIREAVGALQHA